MGSSAGCGGGGSLRPAARSTSSAEQWARAYASQPLVSTSTVTYPGGITVDIAEFVPVFLPISTANSLQWARMAKVVDEGSHVKQSLHTYRMCDKELNGYLTWSNGEVREFVLAVFQHYRLSPPPEAQIYSLYMIFDQNRSMFLAARECLCLVDALFRAIFAVEPRDSVMDLSACAAAGSSAAKRAPDSDRESWDIPSETPSLSVASTPRVGGLVGSTVRRRSSVTAPGSAKAKHSARGHHSHHHANGIGGGTLPAGAGPLSTSGSANISTLGALERSAQAVSSARGRRDCRRGHG